MEPTPEFKAVSDEQEKPCSSYQSNHTREPLISHEVAGQLACVAGGIRERASER